MNNNLISESYHFSKSHIINYRKKGDKIGGQVSKANLGGVYEYKSFSENYTVLFKQGRNDGETISEFLAAKLYHLVIPGYASQVILAKYNKETNTKLLIKKDLHTEVYVGSIFFENFNEVHKLMHFKKRPTFLLPFYSNRSKEFVQYNYASNLGKVLAVSLWLGDYDTHISNLGIAKINDSIEFVKIDHGWSFAQLQDNMDYNKTPWSGFQSFGKPTNHFADFKQYGFYKNSEGEFLQMIDTLKKINKEQIKFVLRKAFREIESYYNTEIAYKSFAKWIGYKTNKVNFCSEEFVVYLSDKLEKRLNTNLKRRNNLNIHKTSTTYDKFGNVEYISTRL